MYYLYCKSSVVFEVQLPLPNKKMLQFLLQEKFKERIEGEQNYYAEKNDCYFYSE